eukprot:7170769-Pyramimonas_sp.AAC.1
MLRCSASIPIAVWRFKEDQMIFGAASDAGGIGAARPGRAQQAWQVYAADQSLSTDRLSRVTPLAWRSSRLRRQVPPTLGGE